MRSRGVAYSTRLCRSGISVIVLVRMMVDRRTMVCSWDERRWLRSFGRYSENAESELEEAGNECGSSILSSIRGVVESAMC